MIASARTEFERTARAERPEIDGCAGVVLLHPFRKTPRPPARVRPVARAPQIPNHVGQWGNAYAKIPDLRGARENASDGRRGKGKAATDLTMPNPHAPPAIAAPAPWTSKCQATHATKCPFARMSFRANGRPG